ncbi:MAG TPA: Tex-like N-terminal domain-containing protein, partial [Blastocatellia bacterium]|nr:Tex-like N-terminal domain-containing protein [Blastocatellia bacterium]
MSEVEQPENLQPEAKETEASVPEHASASEPAEHDAHHDAHNGSQETTPVTAESASESHVADEPASASDTAATESPVETESQQSTATETAAAEPASESVQETSAQEDAAPAEPTAVSHETGGHDEHEHDSVFASDSSIAHAKAGEAESTDASAGEHAKEHEAPITLPPEVRAELMAKTLGRLLEETQRKSTYVTNLISLLEEGATAPFIARYRKELTGSMDEPVIRELRDRWETLFELELRKQAVLMTIGALGKLTPELEQRIRESNSRTELDDIYLPFRPKRKNRATVAHSRGLEPLAKRIFETRGDCEPLHELGINYLNPRRGVNTIQQALAGAAHIIAEWIAEDTANRRFLRDQFAKSGKLVAKATKGKETERSKYESFYNFSEAIKEVPSHRFLAIRRGEKEKFLNVALEIDRGEVLRYLNEKYVAAPYSPPSESSTAALLGAETDEVEPATEATADSNSAQPTELAAEPTTVNPQITDAVETVPEAATASAAPEAISEEGSQSENAEPSTQSTEEHPTGESSVEEAVTEVAGSHTGTEAAPTETASTEAQPEQPETSAELAADTQAAVKSQPKKPQSLHPASSEVNAAEFLRVVINDAFDRLLFPAIENELRNEIKRRADADAIDVFAKNLSELLLAPPAGAVRVLGINPGLRTGCKVAVVTETGKFIFHGSIYPHAPQKQWDEAKTELRAWIGQYQVSTIAIGNGTASRETLQLAREVAHEMQGVKVALVNEAGVSVYSTSRPAREEFPEVEAAVRGAISIARRLQDPLAEMVKVEPRSIGVGQYQHDVDQGRLRRALNAVVESCVNRVGVDINSASVALLSYVSGVGISLAREVSGYRNNLGRFNDRQEIGNVPRFTPKHFEQAAGFFRIREGNNPLDNTSIHPEKYPVVERMAAALNTSVKDLLGNKELIDQIHLQDYADEQTGLPTLRDIVEELRHPGRDPRQPFETVDFREDIRDISDLKVGLELEGIVSNITNFGAFVDIGVHQDGLVHISHLSRKFIKDPHEAVHVGQKVKVKVIEVDTERRRIGLSVKDALPAPPPRPRPQRGRPEARGQAEGAEAAGAAAGDRRPGRGQGDGRGRRRDQQRKEGGRPRDDRQRQAARPGERQGEDRGRR